jgi:hypothetical protein
VPAAFLLLALTGAWIWLSHLTRWPVLRRVVAGAVTLVSLSTIGLTYIVGHSGAEAVWADSLDEARVPPATAAFSGEHAGQAEPEGWLDVFRVGQLG